jgi:hypothetical protein
VNADANEHLQRLVRALQARERAKTELAAARREVTEALTALRQLKVPWSTVALKATNALGRPLPPKERLALAEALRKQSARAKRTQGPSYLEPTHGTAPTPAASSTATTKEADMAAKLMKRVTITEEFAESPDELSGIEDLGNAENEDSEEADDVEPDADAGESPDEEDADRCEPRPTKRGGRR